MLLQQCDALHPGLSPHRRGTQNDEAQHLEELRFIPAQAGNTFMTTPDSLAVTVYPRTGGEHVPFRYTIFRASGLSPHRRGTPRDLNRLEYGYRFIPAQAGNTTAYPHPLHWYAVYPRTGGEHRSPYSVNCMYVGLSPHRRGTRRRMKHPGLLSRFIPAQAGNTE